MRFAEERRAVAETAAALYRHNLTAGTSGNVSCRLPEEGLLALTPHGDKSALAPEDVFVVSFAMEVIEGDGHPSVEAAIHVGCYEARPDVGAVIHSHPVHASMFALAGKAIPNMIDEVAVEFGLEVPVAEYGISGTPELAAHVVSALGRGRAVLMANHGMVTVGDTLEKALLHGVSVERTAAIVLGAMTLGGPVELPEHARALYQSVYEYSIKPPATGA